jgi:translocation and assembly module TamB
MATDAPRGHQKRVAQPTAPSGAPPLPQKRRWWLWLTLAAIAVIVWLLPVVVVHTPLLHWILGKATADLNGTVTVGSASLGWLSPVVVENVEVKDAKGRTVLSLPNAAGDRSLAAILCNYTNLGQFTLDGPKVSIVLSDDGSNVEDMLAKYLAPKEEKEKSSTKISVGVKIVDASVAVTEERTGLGWRIDKLGLGVDMVDGTDGPMNVDVSAEFSDPRRPGKLKAGVKMASGAGEATLSAEQIPLAMFRALVARFSPGTLLAGQLSSTLHASWGGAGGKNSVQADVDLDGFACGSPILQGDAVQLERCHAGGQVSWQADRVQIEKASVECDFGNVSLDSTLLLGEKGGFAIDTLLQQQYELSGRLDLARLAQTLPNTLHLRREVQVKSGQVRFSLGSRPGQEGMAWDGQLDAANITATAGGRPVAWARPVSLAIKAHETPAGPVVDALTCESDFLKLHANGTPDALAASLSFNLKQLADQLGQFVDFGTMQLSGEGMGNFNWKRSPSPQFAADAEVHLAKFQLALPNQPPWHEDELVAIVSAKGQTDLSADTRIDAATVSIKAGADQFDVQLIEAVKDLRNGGVWPVRLRAQGQLQNWPGRLAAWLPMNAWQIAGAYAIEAEGTGSKDRVDLRDVKVAAAPLIVSSSWLHINEPRVDAAVVGSWNQQQRRLLLAPATLNCATIEIKADNFVLAMPDGAAMETSGTLNYQGDVGRLRQWFASPAKAIAWQLAGQLRGSAQLREAAGTIHGETTTEVLNLAVVDATGQQAQEPSVRLTAHGDYNSQAGTMQIEQIEVVSDAINAKIAGRVAPVSGENNAQIEGQIGYDLERMSGLLRPWLGLGVRMTGKNSSVVSYRGPCAVDRALATGKAAAGLRWDSINAYGVQVGPGELKAAMADGIAQIEPLDLAVSQGRLHLAPRVRLTPDPIELTLPAGPLAQQIQIDPAMCGASLKYMIPSLAGVTAARGAFSIDLDGCRIPLGDPAKGELAGRFTIHSMEVGPGALTSELGVLLSRASPANLRPNSVVPFRMVNGRVYHDGLELMFPEFSIRTRGSVGLDQTLAVEAEMPVPPKWLGNNPMIPQTVRNQTIRVPIAGTLAKPQLDQRVMQDLTRQFIQKAAGNVIEGGLNNGLNQLFGPKK